MCVYARTIFECQHEIWGRRVKLCATGQSFEDATELDLCTIKVPHGLHTIKLARECSSCARMTEKLSAAWKKLAGCREEFGKKWKVVTQVAVENWLDSVGSAGDSADVAPPDKQEKELVKSDDGWIRAGEDEEKLGSLEPEQVETDSGPVNQEESMQTGFDKSSEISSSRSSEEAHYVVASQTNIEDEAEEEEVVATEDLDEAPPAKEPEKSPCGKQKPKAIPRSRLAVPVSKLPRLSTPPKVVSKLPRPQFQSKIAKPMSRS